MKAGTALIGGLCTWESAAILTGLLPTITSTTRKLPAPARMLVVASFAGWLWGHMGCPSPLDRLVDRIHVL